MLDNERSYQIMIEPSAQQNKRNQTVEAGKRESLVRQNSELIKKTQSFDVMLEGWGHESGAAKSPKAESRSPKVESKSEMFYSIRECSAID